jgi:DNA-binding GntR family transcriptional regulator
MTTPSTKPASYQIKRKSLPTTLAESLRERILNGDLKEGDQLIQEVIAQEYDVSRMPVREALRQLEASGLVQLQAHKGAVVTSIPIGQIAELFDLRALLECELLAHAIPNMTAATFATARVLLDSLEAAYHDGNVSAWGHLNWEFHQSLYQPSKRIQTLALVQSVNIQTDRYIRLQLSLTGALQDAEEEHRKLLQFCEERNTVAAVDYLRKHIKAAGSHLVTAMQNYRQGNQT